MYSYEIDQMFKSKNYNIDSDTYMHICGCSPQISTIIHEPYNDDYEIWTNDNFYWKFKVNKSKNML